MGRIFAVLASVLLILCGAPACAGDTLPRVLFPAGLALPAEAEGVVTVEDALLQIEVQRDQIISAQRGTRFSMAETNGVGHATQLNVLRGTLILANLQTNVVTQLPIGSYVIAPEADNNSDDDTATLAPRYRLSDVVMTQQQKYLDSLKIEVRTINKALASIIRSLVPRRP